ncbi:MAG: D-glycero-beta-D-manno-heptose 1,7-bisphosphate 7-phosphatase [Mariprofundaceae bacterium]|nr:D-glycero-beta-D-manno-heptose 1,7-bisphosphate 7-phosphatase [Mariprofundaceae bacterium]
MRLPEAVLLDRDGVINFDSPDYILTPEQWKPIPGSPEAIARLTRAGIPVAICSNQSGLGRGMMNEELFHAIHAKMLLAIEEAGGMLTHSAYCPHSPEEKCSCRKPLPGLILEALDALDVKANEALMIGDSTRDIEAACAAGVDSILVQTGYGNAEMILQRCLVINPKIKAFPDLATAVDSLLGGH